MGLLGKIFGNTRRPEGFFGRLMVRGMNGSSHARLANWALDQLSLADVSSILDLGCGGGANLARLQQRCPNSHTTGLDYSPVSVEHSKRTNAKAIAAGRCHVVEGDVSKLPFPDAEYDLVTAFETVYFWPDMVSTFQGIRRVLKPGGRFLIVNESDGISNDNSSWERIIPGMHTYTADELRSLLSSAGFTSIEVKKKAPWLMVTAQ